jgi:hypothetical protein
VSPQKEYQKRLYAYNAALAEQRRLESLAATTAAAATLAAQNRAQAEAMAGALDIANEAAKKLVTDLQSAANETSARDAVSALLNEAIEDFDTAKGNQASAAQETANAQRAEAEAAAQAKVAADAALAAAQLKSALDAATTKAQQDAAAQAAREAAETAKNNAITAAQNAVRAAADALEAQANALGSLTNQANRDLASDYKLSNPAAAEQTRSAKSFFTPDQLANLDGTLKRFIQEWDTYVEKQREKYAALAERDAKEAAFQLAKDTETAVKNAASIAAAKAAAQTALITANANKKSEEDELVRVADIARQKALDEATRLGQLLAAEIAKEEAAKLAAEVDGKNLAAIQTAAQAASDALSTSQLEEAQKAAQAILDAATAAAAANAAKDDVAVLPVLTPPTPPAATPI